MKYLVLFFAVLIWSGASAQLDNSNTNTSGGSFGRDTRLDRSPTMGNKSKRMLGQPDKLSLDDNDANKKVNMRQEEKYVKRETEFNPGYLKEKEERKVRDEYSEPQDLGKFSSDAKFVKISARDFQAVDGDRVDIIVNGEVLVHNVTLVAKFQTFYIDLEKGFNKIEFKALNQGMSGPNTAGFKVVEDNGTILTHDEWNLTTGTKASLVIVKNK